MTANRRGTIGYFFGYVYVGALLTLAACVFFCIGYGWPFLMDHIEGLPGIEQVNDYNPNIGSRLYSRDGEPIAEFFREKSGLARYDELPKHLIDALIATEDQQFYKHNGVNPFRIAMAAYANVTSGRIEGGGSTITQQIAKDLYTNWEKSYQRKIKEALYALKIEQVLSKQEIITIYLNQVMYGHNTRGIRAAAEFYFGKEPIDLTLAESATLIGVLKGNTIYSPLANYERSKARRGVVLNLMVDCGFITEEEAAVAKEEQLDLRPKKTTGAPQLDKYPYWTHFVRDELLLGELAPGHVPLTADQMKLDDESILYGGGLEVRTTLDPQMQEWGTQALQSALIEQEKVRRKNRPGWGLDAADRPSFDSKIFPNANLLGKVTGVVEPNWLTIQLVDVPGTPEVAVVQPGESDWRTQFGVLSPGYYVPVTALERVADASGGGAFPEQDLVNRGLVSKQDLRFILQDQYRDQHAEGAFVCLEVGTGRILSWVGGFDWHMERPGYQRVRAREGTQPGSSLKPIIYALAFENGYTPTTLVSNEPYMKIDPVTGKVWKPTNYYADKYGGQVKIRSALIQSLNLPTVRVFETLYGRAYTFDPTVGKQTLEITRRMGIRTPITKDMGLSVSLGTPDVSPLEMATAYSVLANQGILVRPYAIESVFNPREGTRAKHIPSGDAQALDPTISFQLTSILVGVMREQSGTGFVHAQDFPYPVAGKTGTTNRYFDAWFVGYSKNLVTALWIGHDRRTSLGVKRAGGMVTLPPWLDFMKKSIPHHLTKYKGMSLEEFQDADGKAIAGGPLDFDAPDDMRRVEVCAYSLLRPNAYCNTTRIWLKKGDEPQMVCRDCGLPYSDVPKVSPSAPPVSGVAANPAYYQPPVERRRLEPRPAVGAPPSEANLQRARSPGVQVPMYVPQGVQPAVPRPVAPRGEGGSLPVPPISGGNASPR